MAVGGLSSHSFDLGTKAVLYQSGMCSLCIIFVFLVLKFDIYLKISYWFHLYPELYFLRARKEDIPARIQYYTLHVVIITAAYIFK